LAAIEMWQKSSVKHSNAITRQGIASMLQLTPDNEHLFTSLTSCSLAINVAARFGCRILRPNTVQKKEAVASPPRPSSYGRAAVAETAMKCSASYVSRNKKSRYHFSGSDC